MREATSRPAPPQLAAGQGAFSGSRSGAAGGGGPTRVTAGLSTLLKLNRPNCRTMSSKSSLQKFNRQIRVKLKHRANNKATYLKAA